MKPSHEEWEDDHYTYILMLVEQLDLPIEMVDITYAIWMDTYRKAPRTPKSLVADCVYIVAKMTGNRRSIPLVADASRIVLGSRIRVLPNDKRNRDRGRWINTEWGKKAILTHIPDEEAFDDMTAEYKA